MIKKYLGFGLFPKAGVTVGLALLAKQHIAFSGTSLGNIMISAILASVVINELIAPPLTKYALIKSGEIAEENNLDKISYPPPLTIEHSSNWNYKFIS